MSEEKNRPRLEFTGERFTPEIPREIWYEHYHRYALAAPLVKGLKVLDAACGEGYGSALLAAAGADVTAVDISAQTIEHARQRYSGHANLAFLQADVSSLDLPGDSFDAIVSFETLEHLDAQEEMLAGFRRILKDAGWLLISSPDKAEYSDATGYRNPWHRKELYRQELLDLLAAEFPAVRLFGQKLAFHSLVWDLQASGDCAIQTLGEDSGLRTGKLPEFRPLYFLALCGASESCFPEIPELNLFADDTASIYAHYQHEIRKNMSAGEIIQQRDARILELEERLKRRSGGFLARWFGGKDTG